MATVNPLSDAHFLADTFLNQQRCFRFVLLLRTVAPHKPNRTKEMSERSLVHAVTSVGDFCDVLEFVADDRDEVLTQKAAVDLYTHVADLARRHYEHHPTFDREAPSALALDVRDDVRYINPVDEFGDRR